MRKLIIGVDLDDTLNNLVASLLVHYNQEYNDNLTIEEITEYSIHKFLKPECTNIFKEFANDDLFLNLQPEPNAVEVLQKLNREHILYFVTAAHPKTLCARDKWLAKHLDFYSTGQLINCRDKFLIKLDVLIDDCLMNHMGDYYSLVYDKPWNRNSDKQRVFNWLDVEREINRLAIQ